MVETPAIKKIKYNNIDLTGTEDHLRMSPFWRTRKMNRVRYATVKRNALPLQ